MASAEESQPIDELDISEEAASSGHVYDRESERSMEEAAMEQLITRMRLAYMRPGVTKPAAIQPISFEQAEG